MPSTTAAFVAHESTTIGSALMDIADVGMVTPIVLVRLDIESVV